MTNEDYRLVWAQLESFFETTGSDPGSEVSEPRLVWLKLRLNCWRLGSGSRLRMLRLKNSHEILH